MDDWPKSNKKSINDRLDEQMKQARQVVEMIHAQRKQAGIKVRQPLRSLVATTTIPLYASIQELVRQEVNVKVIANNIGKKLNIKLDLKLNASLITEGEMRDIIRQIQAERKKLGTRLDEKVDVNLPNWPKEFENEIKRRALIDKLEKANEFKVVRK